MAARFASDIALYARHDGPIGPRPIRGNAILRRRQPAGSLKKSRCNWCAYTGRNWAPVLVSSGRHLPACLGPRGCYARVALTPINDR